LIEQFEGGRNAWMTWDEAASQPKAFKSFDVGRDILSGKTVFVESRREYSREAF
jgi:hypothetical protein